MKDVKAPEPLQAKGWGKTAKVPDLGRWMEMSVRKFHLKE